MVKISATSNIDIKKPRPPKKPSLTGSLNLISSILGRIIFSFIKICVLGSAVSLYHFGDECFLKFINRLT